MTGRIKFNYAKLRGRIVEKYRTITEFSKTSGIRAEQFTDAFKGERTFTQSEIKTICDLLEIPDAEIATYFFAT